MAVDEKARKLQAQRRVEGLTGRQLVKNGNDFELPDGHHLLMTFARGHDRTHGVTYWLGLPPRMSPGDVNILLLRDADFVVPADVLLQYGHLYSPSKMTGRLEPYVWKRLDGQHAIRLAEVDRWVSLEPYRDAYGVLAASVSGATDLISKIGVDFTDADEAAGVKPRDPFVVDPDLVDRGTRGHARTLNSLAAHLRGAGLEPRAPGPGEPQFDLVWTGADRTLCVAEVKSLTLANAVHQLRLGLGQVLQYRFKLHTRLATHVAAALVVEAEPPDASWLDLCASIDVILTWPPDFEHLMI